MPASPPARRCRAFVSADLGLVRLVELPVKLLESLHVKMCVAIAVPRIDVVMILSSAAVDEPEISL